MQILILHLLTNMHTTSLHIRGSNKKNKVNVKKRKFTASNDIPKSCSVFETSFMSSYVQETV